MAKITSLDPGYVSGLLSVYPEAKDTKNELYEVANNAESLLTQSLTYNGKIIFVNNNDLFPEKGILRIGPPAGETGAYELIYYAKKSNGVFKELIRGFAGSRQNPWKLGSSVGCSVMAQPHNALKDAIINIQKTLGTENFPEENSLNAILKSNEVRFLSPKPLFRAFPIKGKAGTKVRFQNFSSGEIVAYLWDFGDGVSSIEKSPIHQYQSEGIYTVSLNIVTSNGGQGIVTKSNYITISDEERPGFFYCKPKEGNSIETAVSLAESPQSFKFVDQTDGEISQRHWVFDDGTSESVLNPNENTITHTYTSPGVYEPSLIVVFPNQKIKRIFLKEKITVF